MIRQALYFSVYFTAYYGTLIRTRTSETSPCATAAAYTRDASADGTYRHAYPWRTASR